MTTSADRGSQHENKTFLGVGRGGRFFGRFQGCFGRLLRLGGGMGAPVSCHTSRLTLKHKARGASVQISIGNILESEILNDNPI